MHGAVRKPFLSDTVHAGTGASGQQHRGGGEPHVPLLPSEVSCSKSQLVGRSRHGMLRPPRCSPAPLCGICWVFCPRLYFAPSPLSPVSGWGPLPTGPGLGPLAESWENAVCLGEATFSRATAHPGAGRVPPAVLPAACCPLRPCPGAGQAAVLQVVPSRALAAGRSRCVWGAQDALACPPTAPGARFQLTAGLRAAAGGGFDAPGLSFGTQVPSLARAGGDRGCILLPPAFCS